MTFHTRLEIQDKNNKYFLHPVSKKERKYKESRPSVKLIRKAIFLVEAQVVFSTISLN